MSQNVQYVLSLKDLFSASLQNANKGVQNFDSTISNVKSNISSLGSALGIAFGGAGIVVGLQKIIQAGTTVENATTGLTTLLKSNAEAQQVVSNTMEDASKTPFEFVSLLNANKALISAGENAVTARENVLNLGNAIAASGGSSVELERMVVNLQQIKNTGKATAMDIKQFAIAGINIYKVLAEATGQPIEKVRDMEVSYSLLTHALKKAGEEGGIYFNGLENMAGNTSIRISNLGDTIFNISAALFEELKPAIDTVISGTISLVEWMYENRDIILLITGSLVAAKVAALTYSAALSLMAARTAVSTAMTFINLAATDGLTAALYAAGVTGAAAWAMMTGGLVLIVGALYVAYQRSETFRGIVLGVWEVLKGFGQFVISFYKNVGEILAGVFTLDPTRIKEGVKGAMTAYKDLATNIDDNFKKGQKSAMAAVAGKGTAASPGSKVSGIAAASGLEVPTDAAATKGSSAKSVTGSKSVTVNVTIGNLVDKFTVQSTNITESPAKIREMIAATLIGVVNDSQIVAGT